jgi:GTPase SAR1 family protein
MMTSQGQAPRVHPGPAQGQGQMFDVKVALLGPISSGKTTVLNALLGDNYGHVKSSMSSSSEAGANAHSSKTGSVGRTSQEATFYRLYRTQTRHTMEQNDSFEQPTAADAEASMNSHYPRSNITSHYGVNSAHHQQGQASGALALVNTATPATAAVATNPTHRQSSSSSIPEKYVDVFLPKGDLFQMRQDTQLVLIDIPGLETRSNNSPCHYTTYVKQQWDSFDCVIVVLDVTANPSDQEHLLQFVKHQLDTQTRHPVLCLWNKLDDPYDPKALQIIKQTQKLITMVVQESPTQRKTFDQATQNDKSTHHHTPFVLRPFLGLPHTFGPPMTETELQTVNRLQQPTPHTPKPKSSSSLLEAPTTVHDDTDSSELAQIQPTSSSTAPAIPSSSSYLPLQFLPLSAKEALVFKRVAHMTLDDFAPYLEQDWMVERLGRDQIGLRKWNRLSRQEQIEESYYMLKDPLEYERALVACGYTAVEAALGSLVGNHEGAQTLILETRMEFSLRALLGPDKQQLSSNKSLLAPQLYSVLTKFQVLYGNTEAALSLPQELQSAFWAAYDKMEVAALQTVVHQGLGEVQALAEPIAQLLSYYSVAKALGWADGSKLVARKMKHLISQFLQLLFEQESIYDYDGWGDEFQATCHQQAASPKNGNKYSSINYSAHDPASPWKSLSPKDWIHIWSCILLVSYDRYFCQHFAREKLVIEDLLERARQSWKSYAANLMLRVCPHCFTSLEACQNEWRCRNSCRFAFHTCFPSTACNNCTHRFDNVYETEHVCPGNGLTYSTQQTLGSWMRTFYDRSQSLVPNFPALYNQVVRLGDIPESLTDANHTGHVFYQFCHLHELLQEPTPATERY